MSVMIHAQQRALAVSTAAPSALSTYKRTSNLTAPIMHLTGGHGSEIFSCKFAPNGNLIASAGFDKSIRLWNVYGDASSSDSSGFLEKSPILDLEWSADSKLLFSGNADGQVHVYDVTTQQRLQKYAAHSEPVNSIAQSSAHAGNELLVASGSDDGYILLHDPRSKDAVSNLCHSYPVLAVEFSASASSSSSVLFSAGIDNSILTWDLRTLSALPPSGNSGALGSIAGHADSITCLKTSQDGTMLLSNGFDNVVMVWDIKPFSSVPGRLLARLEGAPHAFDKNLLKGTFSPSGSHIAMGSGDRTVVVWSVDLGEVVYKLPGHKGTVNQVDWHPTEPVLGSCSNDATLFLGEISV